MHQEIKIPYKFNWNNGATTDSVISLPAGQYSVTVTDSFGCSVQGHVSITQPQALSLMATAHSPLCASSNSGSAAAIASGGAQPYSYLWSSGGTTDSVSGLAPGQVKVTVTDSHNCNKDTTLALVPAESINIDQQQITPSCTGAANGTLSISVAGGTTPYMYRWSNGASTQNITGIAAGSITVTVTDAVPCSATFSDYIPVENFSASVTAQPGSSIFTGDEVTLNVTGPGLASASWSPAVTYLNASGTSVSTGPAATTVYHILCTSDNGCEDSLSIKITVQQKPQWLIPTGFSPNGDGVNDVFHVILKGAVELVSLEVFNRWGEKVFETADFTIGWDGTYKGLPQPMGVYIYEVIVRDVLNGNTLISEKGNVTLVR